MLEHMNLSTEITADIIACFFVRSYYPVCDRNVWNYAFVQFYSPKNNMENVTENMQNREIALNIFWNKKEFFSLFKAFFECNKIVNRGVFDDVRILNICRCTGLNLSFHDMFLVGKHFIPTTITLPNKARKTVPTSTASAKLPRPIYHNKYIGSNIFGTKKSFKRR